MPRSVFDGYLVPECETCPDWEDGVNSDGLGCGAHFPIMECPYFARMYEEEENRSNNDSHHSL